MHAVMLNGKAISSKDLSLLANALSTPEIVTEKGGYLFKSWMDGRTLHLGVVPNFLNGQRTYHYDIDIGPSEFTLVGSLNANGTLTALFKPDRDTIGHPLPEEDRKEYRRQYAHLAHFLINCNVPASFPLDEISIGVLQETNICDRAPVNCIGQLASLEKPL